ncbi:cytotoxic T-lymphocyte protein 4-like [Pristis pectinata]|uniref:cytotoxic T-lymphocyte protein 4-like n=1 Tax=Pristis pectinata TaxID=685728 RepID=UPI00223E099E|nr:cytotoxic T-lymphocyte protein 4-like [Pristis pectinata]
MERLRYLFVAFLWMLTAGRASELKVSQPGYLGVSSMGRPALECVHNSDNDAELKLTILKGSERSTVCSGTTSSSIQIVSSSELLHCRFERIPNKVSVMIHGLNSSLTDNYFCKIEKLYPPPYESDVGNGTIIYIRPEDMKCPQFSFLLVMGILTPLLLVCMVSIIILITKNKVKKTNVNPVYEQMAPTRGRK